MRFAEAVEPDHAAIRARTAREQAKRERDEATLPSTIGAELETNPFLRAARPAVMAQAAAHAGRNIVDPVDSFAALRAWKDGFR